ncbi:MAG: pro-sigmaK processing inhibitor BofA family protein [Clostridia bacterium]|nr:pro-sigmaK processing inhibitor BofA family protein [Clostridia bacterium]
MDINNYLVYIASIIFIFIFAKIFLVPLKSIFKLILNSILGGILIYIINIVGMVFDFHIGLNIVTSILIGVLGVPGAILLVVIKLLLG